MSPAQKQAIADLRQAITAICVFEVDQIAATRSLEKERAELLVKLNKALGALEGFRER